MKFGYKVVDGVETFAHTDGRNCVTDRDRWIYAADLDSVHIAFTVCERPHPKTAG